jgi:hypothetical protein
MMLVVSMEMLGQLEYDDAVMWLADLHDAMIPGTAVVLEGVDVAKRPDVGISQRRASRGWLASGHLVGQLLEAAGWRRVQHLEVEDPWMFRVSATR